MTRGQNRDYQARLDHELDNYRDQEVVHDLPPIAGYWAEKFLVPMAGEFGYSSVNQFYCDYVMRAAGAVTRAAGAPRDQIFIASIGAGNCDTEILLASTLLDADITGFTLECIDLNQAMLDRGRALAEKRNLADHLQFSCTDISAWQPAASCDIIIANQSLHHFQELELLFGRIADTLSPEGYFLTHDMMGRNGHQRWPEAQVLVEEIWEEMPEHYKYDHQWQQYESVFINRDCSLKSFEGIRAQDILPLLMKTFRFDFFLAYANIIDVFIDRGFGPNFDPGNPDDRAFIDRVHALDQAAIEEGRIKPTHLSAAMTLKGGSGETRIYKHLGPAFCLRTPGQ